MSPELGFAGQGGRQAMSRRRLFVEDYNKRFGRAAANAKDLHRPLTEADDLDEILAWREERKVTRNLALRYDRMMLLLDPTPLARGLPGKTVEVVNYSDGRFAVRHDGVALPFRILDEIQTVAPGAIVENKRRSAGLRAGAAGLISAEPSAGRSTTPAAAQQFGGAGYADKGPPIAQNSGNDAAE